MAQKVKGYTPIQVPVGNEIGRQGLRDQMQQLNPITSRAINALSQMGGLSNEGASGLDAYKKQQQNIFNQEIVPGILQRFGGQKGSGLNNALAGASQGLGENLAARREGMQMSALQQLLGLNSQLMGSTDYQHGFLQKPESNLSQFLGKGLPAIASIVSDVMPSSWAGFGSGLTGRSMGGSSSGFSTGGSGKNPLSRSLLDYQQGSNQFGLPNGGYISF